MIEDLAALYDIDSIGYDPHPTDEEWEELTCDLCGARPVTLCAGTCHHYCEDHGPDDDVETDWPEPTDPSPGGAS